jgi:hypothetical protein
VLAGCLYFHFPVSKSRRRSPDLTRWRLVFGQLLIPIGRGPPFLQLLPPPPAHPAICLPHHIEGQGVATVLQYICQTPSPCGVEGGPRGPTGDQLPHPPPHLACLHLVGKPGQRWSMCQHGRAYLPSQQLNLQLCISLAWQVVSKHV